MFFWAHEHRESTANMRLYFLPRYSVMVYPDHLTNLSKHKDANVGSFIAILNLGSADTFFRGV